MNTCLYSKCFFIYCKQEIMKRLFLTMFLFFFAFAFAWCWTNKCEKKILEELWNPTNAKFYDVDRLYLNVWDVRNAVKWKVSIWDKTTSFYCWDFLETYWWVFPWNSWHIYEFFQLAEKQWYWTEEDMIQILEKHQEEEQRKQIHEKIDEL